MSVGERPASLHMTQPAVNGRSVDSLSLQNTSPYNRVHQLTSQNNAGLYESHHYGIEQEYLGRNGVSAGSIAATMPANVGAHDKEIPALLDLPDQTSENRLLRSELFGVPLNHFLFRLTPAFTVYMVCRQRLSQYLIPQQSYELRLQKIVEFAGHFVDLCLDTIYANANDCELLMFWLANSSELCHMFCADVDLRKCDRFDIQPRLMRLVEKTYVLFVEYCRIAIRPTIHTLINVSLEDDASAGNIVGLLEEIIRLIRKAFLNSALTIQLFSQLFHFINMYIFNWLVTTEEGKCYLSRAFGLRLRRRLYKVQKWAERQGLEQACECHMDRIQQTVDLLTTPKTSDQIASLGATCYKLNSVQVRYLLENYVIDPELERPVANELIDHVAFLASGQADAIETQDGHQPQLEETQQLQLPFLFPRDAYLVEVLHGLSPELMAFIISLQEKGIARLLLQNTTSWTCHMRQEVDAADEFETNLLKTSYNASLLSSNNTNAVGNNCDYDAVPAHVVLECPPRPATQPFRATQNKNMPSSSSIANHVQPSTMLNSSTTGGGHIEVYPNYPSSSTELMSPEYSHYNGPIDVVTIHRGQEKSIGLSIVAGHLKSQPIGIYVKKVLEGSPAFRNGRLATGDQLLSVNGQSLVGITQEQAAIKMANAGAEVCFEVAKGAAKRNGLDASLRADEPPLPSQHLPRYQNASMRSLNSKNNAISRGMQPSLRILSNPPNYTSSLHNKSLSASELHSQTDSTSITSDFSHLNPYSSASYQHQPQPTYSANHYQHNNQPSALYSKLPAHYRPSNIRPSTSAQLIDRSCPSPFSTSVQPNSAQQQRQGASPTSIIHNGEFRDASDNYSIITKHNSSADKMFRQNSASSTFSSNIKAPLADAETVSLNSMGMMQSSADNAFNEQQQRKFIAVKIGSSSIDSANRAITGLPQKHAYTNSSSSTSPLPLPSFNKNTNLTFSPANSASSNTSSSLLASPMRTSALTTDHQDTGNNRIPPPVLPKSNHTLATASGRRSAPLFDAHEMRTPISTVDEIKSELNRLQLAGLNTDAEKFHYNQLLQRLQLTSKSSSALPNNSIHNRQLLRQIHSASVLGVESRHQPQPHLPYMSEMADRLESNRAFPLLRNRSRTPQLEATTAVEHAIDDVSAVATRLNQIPLDDERNTTISAKRMTTNDVRKSPCVFLPAYEDGKSLRKRVQFRSTGTTAEEGSSVAENKASANVVPTNENEEPRSQIIGANEIYNDPRQRRLNEYNVAKSLRPVVDGSSLGFRDKMKLFAEQLGEQIPRNRPKISSAEREIEKGNITNTAVTSPQGATN